ncbi:nuclear pore complex protein DDB_G0274915 isoform X2 [Chrysoperla carnea]|uniref:nuclear pore complex protein DDB_G0274915 isoform X2 n=1 Tax=Chrysoperla carnea TaxID=189513 RepID=UPI001D092BF4|nr:nuclear pore complex protein DDB_G0274915 isoform X2 [Chrysoperla carnea]
MFTQSGWDNKRVNRSASVLTPIPCIGSNSLANIGKHTSTPISPIIYRGADLTSNSSMVRPNRIKQPERYSLSDTSYNTSQLNSSTSPTTDRQNSPKSIPNAAGPLLANSRYNIGMGTYTDMHSPGFASRIVQYSGEYGESEHGRERERLTHLAKYGSPGLFPVVNLNKTPLKSVKVAGHRPVTVRIAPPDNSYNMDRSLILNQSLQSPNQQVNNTIATQSEISTRSVLDALKEISRKRIHARDDSIEKNKRQRKSSLSSGHGHTESIDTPLSSKRVRDIDVNNEQSFNGSNGSSPSPKKYKQVKHGYNDIISSLSSSIHLRQQYANKRKSEMAVPKDTDINKQIKLGSMKSSPIKPPETIYNSAQNTVTIVENTSPSINKQTKTTNSKENNSKNTKEKSLNNNGDEINKKQVENFNEGTIVNENGVCRLTFISNPPEKQNDIFVPFKPPTEESKRKRLAALLGALSGEDWDVKTLTKKFFPPDNEEDAVDSPKSTGILVSPGTSKPSDAVKKHVTFNIPSTPVSTSSAESPVASKPEITTTSVSITQPISSTMSFGTSNSLPTSESQSINSPATTQNNIMFENTPKNNETSAGTAPIKFGTPEVSKPATATATTSATPVISFGSTNTTPVINFGAKPTENKQPTLNFGTTPASESKPSGGFSFDLNKKSETSTSTNVSTTTPSFSFGGTTKDTNKIEENKSTFATPFGTAAFSPKSTSESVPITTATNPSFSFGSATNKEDKVQSNTFGTPTTLSFNTQNSAFSTPKTTSSITSPFGSTNVPSFGISTTSTTPAFGASTTSNTPAFGTPTTNAPTFGTSTTNNPPAFGASTTSNAPTFGTSTTSSAPTFGTPTTNNPPAFGSTNTPTFGTPAATTASISFGNSAPAVPSFGSVNTTTSNAPLFGSTTTASNTFAFGSSNTTSAFGKPTTTNQGFGQTNAAPAFGVQNTTANTPSFGSTTTSAFGSTSSGFGAPTTTSSAFGSTPFGSTSNVASPFGGNNAPQFGTPTTTSNAFGATNTGFGTPTTTAQFGSTTSAVASPFGSNTSSTTPAFGAQTTQASGFGTQSTPIFGGSTTQQPTNAFGSNSTSTGNTTNIFGSNNNNSTPSAFGSTNNTSTFGNNSATNKPFGGTSAFTFGASTTTQNNNTFGSTTGGFGNTTTPAFGASSPPAFGAQNNNNNNVFGSTTQSTNSTTTNTAVPLFGSTNQTPAFGTPDNKQPAAFGGFGTSSQASSPSSVFAFGGSQPASNSTNNSNAFQFGAPKPAGSGGFNFSANTTTPSFGSSGGTAPAAFGANQFGATGGAPNMFSIGTGSTAPRPRATARYNRKK